MFLDYALRRVMSKRNSGALGLGRSKFEASFNGIEMSHDHYPANYGRGVCHRHYTQSRVRDP
jgi:hypothetical protein